MCSEYVGKKKPKADISGQEWLLLGKWNGSLLVNWKSENSLGSYVN